MASGSIHYIKENFPQIMAGQRTLGRRISKKYRRTMMRIRRSEEIAAEIQAKENAKNLEICMQMSPWLRERVNP